MSRWFSNASLNGVLVSLGTPALFNKMKILHLTLKKKWFDLIASGEKIIEYRRVKNYWRSRLIDYTAGIGRKFKDFDEIHLHNGDKKESPFMRIRWVGISVIDSKYHKPDNGEKLKGMQFTIFLGEILEIRNYDKNINAAICCDGQKEA